MARKLKAQLPQGARLVIYFIVIILIGIGIFVLGLGSSRSDLPQWQDYDRTTITFDTGKELEVILADTPALRVRGLSYSPSLDHDLGMFFIFENEGYHGFWMKDMKYPIDIFWFDIDGKLVYAEHDVSPDSFPQSFGEHIQSHYVLETNSGTLQDFHSIEKGIEKGVE